MISSMTGYARVQTEHTFGLLTWEIRSVNHRYLESTFRLPEQFRFMEIKWKQRIAKRVSRGKLDLTLKFHPSLESNEVSLNESLVKQLSDFSKNIVDSFPNAQTNIADILNWPGVLQTKVSGGEVLATAATQALESAFDKLIETRQNEGAATAAFFEERLVSMTGDVEQVTERLPKALEAANERIRSRFEELALEIDTTRLEQELAWLAQKVDVAEEVGRLGVHIAEFSAILKKGGVVGRRLDFLAQELNREANTLASKSIDATVYPFSGSVKSINRTNS